MISPNKQLAAALDSPTTLNKVVNLILFQPSNNLYLYKMRTIQCVSLVLAETGETAIHEYKHHFLFFLSIYNNRSFGKMYFFLRSMSRLQDGGNDFDWSQIRHKDKKWWDRILRFRSFNQFQSWVQLRDSAETQRIWTVVQDTGSLSLITRVKTQVFHFFSFPFFFCVFVNGIKIQEWNNRI